METMSEVKVYRNLINGEMRSSSSGETLDCIDPASGKVWAEIPSATKEDTEEAIRAARQAFKSWSKIPPAERAALLRKITDLVQEHGNELAELETRDNGWVIRETIYGVIPTVLNIWQDAAAGALTLGHKGSTLQLDSNSFAYTIREPIGVIAGILPWNSPLFLFTMKAAYTLAAGNTVIIKPSEMAAASSLRYAELLNTIIPPGVLNVVSGTGKDVGETLVSHPDIDKVSLTGSGQTARAIVRTSANSPKPLIFELGGKSPNIVFADADLQKAAEGITTNGIFTGNAGQICVGGSRILIQRPVFEEMLSYMVEKVRKDVRLGDPLNPETTMGPIANEAQYKKVCAFLESGIREGGEILMGGGIGGQTLLQDTRFEDGYWVEPTLFKVPHRALQICREEIFGPVAVVMPFDTDEEALRMANDTAYGLGAGIWTNDLNRAHRMVRNIEAGNVWVNTYRRVTPELPFGGFKESGFGTDSLLEYTREKSCIIELDTQS